MNERADDAEIAEALRTALAARDSRHRTPTFGSLLAPRRASRWWPAYGAAAAAIALVVIALVVVQPREEDGAVDLALAQQLSSPDYWRGPTDRLLAQNGAGADRVLPDLPTYDMSLEDSWL